MSKTMRAAQKTNLEPLHYKKIVDRLQPRRNFMLDLAEAIEAIEPDAPEAKRLRYKCDIDLTPRIRSAIRQNVVACRMRADAAARGAP